MNDDKYEWHLDPPAEDGDFYYDGPVPGGDMHLLSIVQVSTRPDTKDRIGCILLPPGWRGDETRRVPEVVWGPLDEWKGRWSGPEHGLTCIVVPFNVSAPGEQG